MLEETLFGTVVAGARQSSQIYQQRDFVEWIDSRLRRKVEVEGHFAIGGGGIVGAFQELAAEAGDGGFCCYGHWLLDCLCDMCKGSNGDV